MKPKGVNLDVQSNELGDASSGWIMQLDTNYLHINHIVKFCLHCFWVKSSMLTLDFKIWIASFRLLISTHEFGPTFMTSCQTFSIKILEELHLDVVLKLVLKEFCKNLIFLFKKIYLYNFFKKKTNRYYNYKYLLNYY
jgi:hypothetical protein